MEARITNLGGIVMALMVPDRHGRAANVVVGRERPGDYAHDTRYLGAIIGRCANRIAHGRFTIDGTRYQVTTNEAPHHLHGGRAGFNRTLWRVARQAGDMLALAHTSPDGDEGYPGTVEVSVTYRVTDANELVVEYGATTDQPTPLNLTQHSYFNLAGGGTILDHRLEINADRYTPVDEALIPTGEIAAVGGTAYDFRTPAAIGERRAGDYDVNFVLNGDVAARVADHSSGRSLEVRTTEPGLQLYTSAPRYDGFCLETQHYPDSPNQPGFPSTILRPGGEYRSQTVFAFMTGRPE